MMILIVIVFCQLPSVFRQLPSVFRQLPFGGCMGICDIIFNINTEVNSEYLWLQKEVTFDVILPCQYLCQ